MKQLNPEECGVPIYKIYNEQCKFCSIPRKKTELVLCRNPIVKLVSEQKKGGSWVINCPSKCKYKKYMIEHKKDLILIKKYINKYADGTWIGITDKHMEWLRNHIAMNSKKYLQNLFYYFGFKIVSDAMKDVRVDNKYVMILSKVNFYFEKYDDEQ